MSEVLITPRRNFLIRALGFTGAGATVGVPIVTVASAEERLKHHMAGVEAAFRDLFPGMPVVQRGNCLDGHPRHYAEKFPGPAPSNTYGACAMVCAGRCSRRTTRREEADMTSRRAFRGGLAVAPVAAPAVL